MCVDVFIGLREAECDGGDKVTNYPSAQLGPPGS